MKPAVLSEQAEADLDEIRLFIARDSIHAADRVIHITLLRWRDRAEAYNLHQKEAAMKRRSAAAFALLATLAVPASLFAKGRTVKITIRGAALTTPIECTDEGVGWFGVWEGPGVGVNGIPQTKGFIIDWAKGVVAERPNGLPRYEVSFYAGCKMSEGGCRTDKPSLAYVVSYEYDPSIERGWVYLPGKGDEWYRLNTFSILRGGLEGNWFIATSEWEKFVRPLIERARAESRVAR